MKTFIAAVALFASAVLAQDPSTLPGCGVSDDAFIIVLFLLTTPPSQQLCVANMVAQASQLGCASSSDVACLCAKPNFGYGVRDCSAQACPAGTDLSIINSFAIAYCSGPAACEFSTSAASN